MIHFTLRHLFRHWRVNLAVLLCLTLAGALAASLSGYADAIAAQELSQTWQGASPSQRTLLITGPRDSLTDELYSDVQEKLGGLVQDRMVVRHATLAPDPLSATEGISQTRTVARLDVYSFDKLVENVRVVEGRFPESVDLLKDPEPWRPPPIEAVIGVRAAAQSGYRIGDQLTATSKYHRLNIVGIVEPKDPRADIWGEDWSAFAPITNTLPLIVESYSMQSFYPMRPVFPHDVSWRITLNPQRLRVDNAAALYSNLINLQTQSATVRGVVSTGLVRILADYLGRLSRMDMAIFLLTGLTLFIVLYTLALFASFVIDRSQEELATLSGRGASVWQITRVFASEDLFLSFAAVLLSPVFAMGALRLWAGSTGNAMPVAMSGEAWALAAAVAVLGWLALVLPIVLAARRSLLERHSPYARPPQQSAMQNRYADVYVLAFGALLYWQLNQADSFVMSRLGNTFLADPVLLIGPALLLVGVAMVLLRVLPWLLQLVAVVFRNRRGLTLSQGPLRLSRDSRQPSQIVLLVSLTTGMVLFSLTLGASLADSPEAIARYLAAALQLNALALVLFGATVFFLTHLFAAEGRGSESGLLHALGLSRREWLTLLMTEGTLVLVLGLVTGAVFGLGLSQIMLPYLSQALAGWQLGGAIEQTTISWPVVVQSYALLIAVYGVALVLLGAVFRRGEGL